MADATVNASLGTAATAAPHAAPSGAVTVLAVSPNATANARRSNAVGAPVGGGGGGGNLIGKFDSYWKLEEAWNAVHADSLNSNNLTPFLFDEGLQDGVCSGHSSHFVGGTYTYLELAAVSSPDVTPTGSFSIPFWFKKDGAGTGYLVSKRRNWVSNLDYAVYSDGVNLKFQIRNSADTLTGEVTSSIVLGGGWYFGCARYDAVSGVISIAVTPTTGNTLTIDSAAWAGGVRSGSDAVFRMGKQDDTSQNVLFGWLDEVGFCNGSALSVVEMEYLAGFFNNNCPPAFPFSNAPGSDCVNLPPQFWYMGADRLIGRHQDVDRDFMVNSDETSGDALPAWAYSTGFNFTPVKAKVTRLFVDVDHGQVEVNTLKTMDNDVGPRKTFRAGEHEYKIAPDYSAYKVRLRMRGFGGAKLKRLLWEREQAEGSGV